MIWRFEKSVETNEPVADTNRMVETLSSQDVVQGTVMNALQFTATSKERGTKSSASRGSWTRPTISWFTALFMETGNS
jgi:hypothetical protein